MCSACCFYGPRFLSIMSVKNLSSPLLKCKCLTIKTSMKKWDLPGIASLLQSSPYVETLDIDIISSYYIGLQFLEKRYIESCNNDRKSNWKSKEIYFKSLLLCLKTVKIFGFEESLVHIKEVFISVVEFLLKNARVLEKMVIAKPQDIQNQRHMLHDFLEVA
ncbi:putative f-box/lrr-repeat protein [Quercus suber]|uniref:F-box/lrr-repeat protein n=1 Tax=Quercus suber TaxID=58331 RepID=A0AAW0KV00_QUESU